MKKKTQTNRKIHGFVLCMLAFGLTISVFGCKKVDLTSEETNTNAVSKTKVLFHSFESVNELYSIDGGGRFGRVSLNKDTNFVTEGKSSVKLEVYGDYKAGTSKPQIAIKLNEDNEFAYSDFSRVKEISFDLFSENEEDKTIDISLTFADETSSTATTKTQEYVVSKGWNTIVYKVDGALLSISHDIKKLSSINILFEKGLDRTASPFLYYMDNMVLEQKIIEWEPLELVQKENELCSFDNEMQISLMGSNCVGPGLPYAPQLSYNQELLYCKNYSGTSLKVEMPAGNMVNNSWPYVDFNMKLFEKYNLTEMALEGKELVFDIYNTGSTYNLGIEYGSSTVKGISGSVPITAKTGWNEIRFPLSKLYEKVGELDEEEVHLSDPGIMSRFIISWCEFVGDDKVMYFDNFRFE